MLSFLRGLSFKINEISTDFRRGNSMSNRWRIDKGVHWPVLVNISAKEDFNET